MRKLIVGSIILIVLLVSRGLLSSVDAADRDGPFRIGALNDAWGPTPQDVGLKHR